MFGAAMSGGDDNFFSCLPLDIVHQVYEYWVDKFSLVIEG